LFSPEQHVRPFGLPGGVVWGIGLIPRFAAVPTAYLPARPFAAGTGGAGRGRGCRGGVGRRGGFVSGDTFNNERMPWFVYLVKCADGTLYCGVTTDISRRLAEHNRGTASRYTRGRRPVVLVSRAPCPDRASALVLEAAVKRLPTHRKQAFLDARSGGGG
jgi:putative endonuclease